MPFNVRFFFLLLAGIFIQDVTLTGQVIGLDLLRNKKSVDVPFELEQGFIIVNVWIENAIPLRMIFDTGAENTILFDKEIAQILNLRFDRQIGITGSDLDSIIVANIVRNTRMQLENCFRTPRDIIVLEDNNLLLKEKLGIEVNGIIGGSFFANLVVKINYTKQRITLRHPKTFRNPPKRYETFDIEVVSGKPYLKADITSSNQTTVRANLLIDSGAALPFLIHTNTDTSLAMPDRVMVGNVGFGLSGAVKGFLGMTDKLQFGSFEFENIATSFQDIFIEEQVNLPIVRNGILGNNLLSRFHMIIDYPREKLYLKATRNYAKPFDFDKSGLTIFAVGHQLNQYYVASVIDGSPADIAGVRVGDIIVKVNNRKTRRMRLQDITRKFAQKTGKRIRLVIMRDDEEIKTEFTLNEWFEQS